MSFVFPGFIDGGLLWLCQGKGKKRVFQKSTLKSEYGLSMINSQGMGDKDGKENFTV